MVKAGRPNKVNSKVENISLEIEYKNNEKVKELLLELGIDALDNYQRNALNWASFYNNSEILNWLLDNGSDINHQDKNGYSSLHFAIQQQHFEATEILLHNKANIEIKDNNGNTPLLLAIFNSKGNYRLVDLLIQSGANLDTKNNHKITPRLLAESLAGFDYELT